MISIMSYDFANMFLGGSMVECPKGQPLFRAGEAVGSMFLVVDGNVDLIRYTASGSRLTLARAGPGDVLAEASAYSETYHCDGMAVRPSRLRAIPVEAFCQKLDGDAILAGRWARSLARTLQQARTNSEIRALRRVSERLDAWIDIHGHLPSKGEWQVLATTLGVSREALYRELSKRRG